MSSGEQRRALERALSRDSRALALVSGQVSQAFAAEHDLHPTDLQALMHIMLADREGTPLTAGDLRALLGVTSGAVTYLVERLATTGHVRREVDPRDRRKVRLRYAPHGMAVANGFFAPIIERYHHAFTSFSDEELDTADRVMRAMVVALQEHHGVLSGEAVAS